ncbi:MAG TPA: polysaccharide deacetylase family protein, partial [Anaerolineae bacterium]|nr:polysaccharide deacetylase family protein [Anaerolineae bacterium]
KITISPSVSPSTSPPEKERASTSSPHGSPLPSPSTEAVENPLPSPSAEAVENPHPSPAPSPPPQPTPDGIRREVKVPILMYHHIAVPPPDADAIRRDLSVPPANFEAHLRYLAEEGYQSISLRDLLFHLAIGQPLPPKPIILTFDDGYVDNYANAFPLLKKYGFTATFFIITDFVDWGYEEYMTWDQLREMAQAGMEIEAHSRDHPDLRGKPLDYLVWQILGPKEAIEAHTGHTVRFFNYPSGRYDEEVVKVLRSAHYWGAVVISQGADHSSEQPFKLRRIRVRGGYTEKDLAWWLDHWLSQ